jgi:hypothetical protein
MGDNSRDEPALEAGLALGSAPAKGALTGPVMRPDWVPWLIASAAFAAYSVISVSFIVRLDPGSVDVAIFTEYVKQYAHLNAPIVDVRSPGLNLLGDHSTRSWRCWRRSSCWLRRRSRWWSGRLCSWWSR